MAGSRYAINDYCPGFVAGAFLKGGGSIDYSFKAKCVDALNTMSTRDVFDNIFVPEYGDRWTYETFKRAMRSWKHKRMADNGTLSAGTLPNFTPHNATVQVDKNGNITQAWIKQHQDIDWLQIRDTICNGITASSVKPSLLTGETMLEIPLFDMHFGIATMETYQDALSEILGIISERQYAEINILFGQDVLHNNDLRGHTAKGTPIEKIDFPEAWSNTWRFFCTLIDVSLQHSPIVNMRYSKGNHDECAAWCLFKALEAAYPQCKFDDSLAPRKCVYWHGCFIGFGHCEYTSKNSLLFQNFVLDFPEEFAMSKVREIHSGHLHRESVDEGFMVRRLPSAVPTDEWSSNNGYTGVHKRFQIFEWAENRLKAIYYV